MEVDVSMIIGYVMKFNYVLPHNVSYLTEPYVRYERSISRRSEPDGDDVSASATGTTFVLIRAKSVKFTLTIFTLAILLPFLGKSALFAARKTETCELIRSQLAM